jgi:septal ring factor EnvC (AmiA/AmiB activator)
MAAQLGKMSEGEKDATIKNLREEIERLKGKVNTIVHSAESSLEEAIESQESMRKQMNSKVSQEQKKYQHLVAENAALKEVIMSLNEELINERAHVEKAMRFMERMKSNPHVQADKNKVFSLTSSFSHSHRLQHT